jgi:hypothetical protein
VQREEMRKIIMTKVILRIIGWHIRTRFNQRTMSQQKKAPLYRRTQRSLFSSADDVEFHKNNARLLIFDIGNNKCSRSIPK